MYLNIVVSQLFIDYVTTVSKYYSLRPKLEKKYIEINIKIN